MENIISRFGTTHARAELMRMLSELSVTALGYVWQSIAYAYYWTDDHNMDMLTEDDCIRFDLIAAAAHDSPDLVRTLSVGRNWIQRMEREESRKKA